MSFRCQHQTVTTRVNQTSSIIFPAAVTSLYCSNLSIKDSIQFRVAEYANAGLRQPRYFTPDQQFIAGPSNTRANHSLRFRHIHTKTISNFQFSFFFFFFPPLIISVWKFSASNCRRGSNLDIFQGEV